ncbi:hypothetical protein PRUB_a3785 [Pseudoalteromonas rubra]|uniref:Probable inorganic carbon transporter subunit DabA n=1 Tax=Pseudoalteromonas rubra TaxID=43658 RepID=A0A8T0C8B7_9GAMM|nr:DUF2309 domain-containing protein [Pseudoalteromonas rubra]KAF7786956.1 hypothetical protein PRUB_a3785 [Pseudoalteromonas rubra]
MARDIRTLTQPQLSAIQTACLKLAPSWPLDQMIAVSPYWPMRDEPIEQVSARLSALGGISMLMPASDYLDWYRRGLITEQALQTALAESGLGISLGELVQTLERTPEHAPWQPLSALLDEHRARHKMAWRDEIIHQISQFCAAHFQQAQPMLHSGAQPELYAHWLAVSQRDRGLSIVLDEPDLHRYFAQLPDDPQTLIAQALDTFGIEDDQVELYAHAMLLDISGWGAWVAYLRWQGELSNAPQDQTLALLAIRMAWELVLWRYQKTQFPGFFATLAHAWKQSIARLTDLPAQHQTQQKPLWIWARAAELSYQQQLHGVLSRPGNLSAQAIQCQVAFCIDVRSEIYRRALEAQSDTIQTMGFAGFFGLPISYQPQQADVSRPQCPGLLMPSLVASHAQTDKHGAAALNAGARWQAFSKSATASFSMVESAGWIDTFKLLKKAFFASEQVHPVDKLSNSQSWSLTQNGEELSAQQKAGLAAGVLHAMGFEHFAPTVLLVGHGSQSTNNLQEAGLGCGACGGQSGEVNVKVLAWLLNDKAVRAELTELGVEIPTQTRFVAALHNTTTDHIRCYGEKPDAQIESWLSRATAVAQKERAAKLDAQLADFDREALDQALIARSLDWSQTRPEWGLANNAAFIVAPRDWTRGLDLQGRSFLHDYQWQHDTDFKVLETIMTAPMLVTHWINMQYNASTTDNLHFGSGNKVLHNAVGGNIGVFEGNGGDLRTGLAMQSLHNGHDWMHQVQRLSVYVAAPKSAIKDIASCHEVVQQLIDNEWLYVFQWQPSGEISRFYQQRWWPVPAPADRQSEEQKIVQCL